MAKGYKNWEKLDNTAKVFPVIANDSLTNTYRISVVLNEEIQPDVLQEALDRVLPKMPGFNLRLRTGFFWYYLEENGKAAPKVFEEDTYPCRRIYPNKNNSYLFRVSYFKNRINLEVFHVLTDGMGGIGFLREITYQYLRLVHPDIMEKLGDGLSEETSLDREDSYVSNYKKASKSLYANKKAFLIKGDKLPYNGFGVVHGFMPVSQLKKVSKEKYGISINEYLISAFVYATYQTHGRDISEKKPIRVAVPVNMRPYFDSITTKNFFVMVSAEFIPTKDDYSFEEIVEIVHGSLKSQINKEHLESIFSYNVSNEQLFVARSVPLFLKNVGIKFVYNRAALANTTTITNIGNIKVKDEYEPYIKMFHSFLSFSKGQELKCTITSYKDTLAYTFTSAFEDTSIQRRCFRQIAKDGVLVNIETNGVYYE
ncbi:MAG: hypothetical protein K6F30_01075 [Lachnospiraceae bacterium]|nr:hypothetical protein [Lachnospiraceae bacterium]